MKPHHLLTVLLVLANIVGAGALVALLNTLKLTWPNQFAMVTAGAGLGQVALAAVWLAWGHWNLAVRAGALLAVTLAWFIPLAMCLGDNTSAAWWGGILLVYGLLITVAVAMARLNGFAITLEGQTPPATNVRPWQFTVGGVLSLTTLVAMLLGVARHFAFPWDKLLAVCLFCTASALGVAASVILAFRASDVWVAVGAPLLVGALLGYLLRFTLLPQPPYEALIWMSLAQGATISLAAGVLQVSGYKLRRREPKSGD